MKRRDFLRLGALALPGLARATAGAEPPPRSERRVVVVGGGFGGAIAAKYVRLADSSIEVVLVERRRELVACPFSNLVIAGSRDIRDNSFAQEKLAANHGIKLVQEEVTALDPAGRLVHTAKGSFSYDRLIVSPGIDFRGEEVPGYGAETPQRMPHAWTAGEQTLLLRSQLEAMADGGTVVVAVPLAPFRAPAAPYERASLIAWYLKARKPNSKVLVLDANPDIVSKGALFRRAWQELYAGMVEYRPGTRVTGVDAKALTLETSSGKVKGAVVNLIPPQRAADLAHRAGLTGDDRRWCPVNQVTFESLRVPGVHVIGDACVAGAMPKSGFAAGSQGRAAALNVVALLRGQEPVSPVQLDVSYSYVNDWEAMSLANVYRVVGGNTVAVPGAGGLSKGWSELEGLHARSWFRNALAEMSS
ncbi:MAG TPA: FAD/NAD(P)-binding oxidoreductase [Burkholderiales bacterium]|nr:FAD/NAD(P)-binding oxidoreductase [Burkholderiales bacterium]